MNLRVALYDTLVEGNLLVRVLDLDNEGGQATIRIFVSGYSQPLERIIERTTLSPVDIYISGTPITGEIHEVTAKLYTADHIQLHDTDTKMIKLSA
jgi:hypothetical protein